MNILVIGSGAREHVIVWKCIQSELVDNVFCAPGNAGIGMIAKCKNIGVMDFERFAAFAKENLGEDGLTIVGPDNPLAAGIVDYFEERGLLILGPTKQAALIEGSKIFCKNFLTTHGIPTGSYAVFAFAENAKRYVRERQPPYVIKADGLALGKGVIIARSIGEADAAIDKLMATDAGKLILIEEFLEGWECSFTVLSDGENFMPLPVAIDYKTLNGQNTGGMGGYSPVPKFSEELHEQVCNEIVCELMEALRESWHHPFKGFLYIGLMITKDGPKVLECNARLGDPEAQVILPRIKKPDFVEICYAAAKGNLRNIIADCLDAEETNEIFVDVVLASPGYPDNPKTGYRIYGLEDMAKESALVFHAGTRLNERGDFFLTNGGRVLSIVGHGEILEKARVMAYRAAEKIRFGSKENPKQVYRPDIALG